MNLGQRWNRRLPLQPSSCSPLSSLCAIVIAQQNSFQDAVGRRWWRRPCLGHLELCVLLSEPQNEEGHPGVMKQGQLVALGQLAEGRQAGGEADGFDQHGTGGLAHHLGVLQAARRLQVLLLTVAVAELLLQLLLLLQAVPL